MQLGEWCATVLPVDARFAAVRVTGLQDDSRLVKPGDAFLAYPGWRIDRRDYIKDALSRGAVAVLYDPADDPVLPKTNIPLLAVPQLASQCGALAARFYQYPARAMPMIGFTGTNGKSSCVHFYAQWAAALGQRCWQLGTLGAGLVGALRPTGLTTPGALALQASLAEAREAGARACAMEVSSHAIAQGRVAAVPFAVRVLTQVGQDHLDYHKTQAAYADCKAAFFEGGEGALVVNLDDAVGQRLAKAYGDTGRLCGYTADTAATWDFPVLRYRVITQTAAGLQCHFCLNEDEATVILPFQGFFQANNVAAVLLALLASGCSWGALMREVGCLRAPQGRMQRLCAQDGLPVFIDYAHTPDALQAALTSLSSYQPGQLWCIVGCGGDRDSCKRPRMGAVAERHADRVVFTADNPRHESVDAIIAMMKTGLRDPDAVMCIAAREEAIAYVIEAARAEDCVLLAGKGHEMVQWTKKGPQPFDEREWVMRALRRRDGVHEDTN